MTSSRCSPSFHKRVASDRKLGEEIRSFPVGNYVVFYKPLESGIEVVRVLSRYRDIGDDEFT